MNQEGYFGAYRSGFKTLPDNAYQMMTAPTQQLASTITNAAGMAAGAYKDYQLGQANTAASKQSAAAQYKGLESMSQAYGVPMNPELANQFMNMGSMKTPQQQAAFQQSLAQEAQRMQMLYGINQAKARAAQAQGMQQMQQSVYAGLGSVPPPDPSRYGGQPVMPVGQNQIDPSLLPSYPSLLVPGYGGRTGPLRPMNQRY